MKIVTIAVKLVVQLSVMLVAFCIPAAVALAASVVMFRWLVGQCG